MVAYQCMPAAVSATTSATTTVSMSGMQFLTDGAAQRARLMYPAVPRKEVAGEWSRLSRLRA